MVFSAFTSTNDIYGSRLIAMGHTEATSDEILARRTAGFNTLLKKNLIRNWMKVIDNQNDGVRTVHFTYSEAYGSMECPDWKKTVERWTFSKEEEFVPGFKPYEHVLPKLN